MTKTFYKKIVIKIKDIFADKKWIVRDESVAQVIEGLNLIR